MSHRSYPGSGSRDGGENSWGAKVKPTLPFERAAIVMPDILCVTGVFDSQSIALIQHSELSQELLEYS